MSTMKIQDLNYDESTTVTLEPSEAASVYGGAYIPGGGPVYQNPTGNYYIPGGGPVYQSPTGNLYIPGGGPAVYINPLGNALAES